ncbi:Hypothetical predicted protein [Xyrichtys novacula]|uniref:Uncharacterized protein n=1 Tax=Xyrichtys novacula TaxID=13765 RepID=A0AAV1FSE5_XYRNO|nr:Hypothetical predicted protein [Xyrichtys novacula]
MSDTLQFPGSSACLCFTGHSLYPPNSIEKTSVLRSGFMAVKSDGLFRLLGAVVPQISVCLVHHSKTETRGRQLKHDTLQRSPGSDPNGSVTKKKQQHEIDPVSFAELAQ